MKKDTEILIKQVAADSIITGVTAYTTATSCIVTYLITRALIEKAPLPNAVKDLVAGSCVFVQSFCAGKIMRHAIDKVNEDIEFEC